MNNDPFSVWQQLSAGAALPFLPPASAEEAARKISELEHIEVWLQFQLQAVKTQKALLEQQKLFFDTLKTNLGGSHGGE